MPKERARKKDESQVQSISKDEQQPERRKTRQSVVAAATPKTPSKTTKTLIKTPKTRKLNQDEITKQIMSESDDDVISVSSTGSNGKDDNDISNYVMDEGSITVKLRRLSGQDSYKVVEYKLGMKKKDATTAASTETLGRTRNRKSIYKSLHEDKLLQWQEAPSTRSANQSKRKTLKDTPKTPTKRPPSQENECEWSSEVDENIIPNANLSPKRSKVVECKKIKDTPTKSRSGIKYTPKKGKTTATAYTQSKLTTPSKSVRSTLFEENATPTKAFSRLQLGTPKTRKPTKLSLKTDNIQDNSLKRYQLRKKKSNALYVEYSSNSESGDDGDNDYDSKKDSVSSEDEEDDEDDASDNSDMYSPKRPKSAKKKVSALTRTPSKSNLRTPSEVSMETPTKLISRMSLNSLTPSVHRRTINIAKPSTPLQEARQKLHVSVLPKSLPCREEEFNNIYSFLHSRLSDLSGGCIYVSGVPGTGKTATVNEVIRCLKKSMNAGKLNDFEFVEINGMRLSEPRQAYVQIWKQLSGNQTTWEVAQKELHNRFTTANSKRGMTLLLVDELDLLCTKRQDVVYNLLDWPSKSTAKLVVVTIANTMDLPERILMGKVTSRLGLTRLTFPPYNHRQLEEIVASRLKGYNAFSGETVQLVARKVAAVSGDARRALDICRRATEVAEMNDREMVTMMDVKTALDEMIASPKIQAIKACSDLEKIFLQAVCSEVSRTGVEEVVFKNVYFQLETLCSFEGEKLPNVTEALSMCARLGAWRLLLCDHSRLDIHQRLLLNVSTDDVYFAIKTIAA